MNHVKHVAGVLITTEHEQLPIVARQWYPHKLYHDAPRIRSKRTRTPRSLAPLRVERTVTVETLVGVGTEIVAQALDQVRREVLAAVRVVVREG